MAHSSELKAHGSLLKVFNKNKRNLVSIFPKNRNIVDITVWMVSDMFHLYNCGVAQAQPWLSEGNLDVLLILLNMRTCTLDVLVIFFNIIGELINK